MRIRALMPARALWLVPALLFLGAAAGPGSVAGVTSLLLDSQPGEFLGEGEFNFYTPSDGELSVAPYNPTTPDDVILTFCGRASWYLDFAAPEGEPLAVGTYENSVPDYIRRPGQPHLYAHRH